MYSLLFPCYRLYCSTIDLYLLFCYNAFDDKEASRVIKIMSKLLKDICTQ